MRSSRYAKRVLTSAIVLATLVAPAVTAQPASATSLSFVQHRPTLGFDPFVVQTGDVDGDGTVDLVLTGGGGGGISVARGNGDGTFRSPFISPPVTWSDGRVGGTRPAVGDINADGRADVVVGLGAWNGINEVAVLLGRSDGSLGTPPGLHVPVDGWYSSVVVSRTPPTTRTRPSASVVAVMPSRANDKATDVAVALQDP
jgi:hypothetical protein